ncbi:MAG: histidine kinase [Lachnospiraceae bacterium]|nr:histidine kinase [Lachnospiraceae bacterium]
MKPQSIHRKMTQLISHTLILMILTCSILLLAGGKIFTNLYALFKQQQTFFSYEYVLTSLQDELLSQFNGTKDSEERIISLSNQLEEIACMLPVYFPHAQFTDTKLLTLEYIKEVQQLSEQYASGENAELLNTVDDVQQLFHELRIQYATTSPFHEKIINQKVERIRNNWIYQILFTILLAGIICSISFIDGRRMVRNIALPLSVLTKQANQISNGDYSSLAICDNDSENDLEIQQLTDAFRCMAETIQQQMDELKDKIQLSEKLYSLEMQNIQMKMMLSQAEMSQIQSLINPHFLFNCIGMLSSMAIIENAPKTHEYSLNIAQFLRSSLNLVGKSITLHEEMQHIRHYIHIQQLRFGTRISFLTECASECENAVLPAIILQPLVENALVHGVGSYPSGGIVHINVELQDEFVRLSVEDNGIGMTDDEIRQILENSSETNLYKQKKTGLYGTIYSLQYYFSGNAGLQIESKNKGVKFILYFPYQTSPPQFQNQ